jgi:hypothetical protein
MLFDILANTLQMPLVEELKITGNKIELMFQSMLRAQPVPKDARKRNIGVKLSYEACIVT